MNLSIPFFALLCTGSVWAQLPEGFLVGPETTSPSGQYGIIAPDFDHGQEENSNAIVTVADGGVLWQIMAPTGFQQMNHGGLYASWDKSERFVLWTVEGKWFPRSLLLIDLEGERLDLKKICQDELLQQARSAFPQAYEATKKAGGMGEAYPDGFTLDFQYERREMLTFPLTLAIGLTNDPKLMRQANAEFAARYLSVTMTAQVTEDLEVTFSDVAVQGPLRAPTE